MGEKDSFIQQRTPAAAAAEREPSSSSGVVISSAFTARLLALPPPPPRGNEELRSLRADKVWRAEMMEMGRVMNGGGGKRKDNLGRLI